MAFRLAIFAALLLVLSGVALEVDCPRTVPEGEPFQVEIRGNGDGAGLALIWLDREIRPRVECVNGSFRATALLGVGMHERLEADSYTLEVSLDDERIRRLVLREAKDYPQQRLTVANEYNELSPETQTRYEGELAATQEALETISEPRRWTIPLSRPVPGEKTSDFGLRRFFNEVPKNPHSGVDLRAAAGDTVSACADGVVILAGDHYFAGNSVYLDHGEGVVSLYFHLSEILVEEGRLLRRGETIGRAGSTGRVTGPHLHWGLSLQGQLVDPLLLLE